MKHVVPQVLVLTFLVVLVVVFESVPVFKTSDCSQLSMIHYTTTCNVESNASGLLVIHEKKAVLTITYIMILQLHNIMLPDAKSVE